MRDDEHRRALLGQRAQHAQHLARQLRVEGTRRLVEAENVRPHRQCPRNGHALLLPAGELVRIESGLLAQADALQKRQSLVLERAQALGVAALSCQQLRRKGHVAQRGILRKQIKILKNQPEMQPIFAQLALALLSRRGGVEHNPAVDGDGAAVGRL